MRFSTLFFDLDDTLYPAESGLWLVIKERISIYMHEKLGLSWQEIPTLRQWLYQSYGTNMRGLKALYNIDESDYLAFVHDIPLQHYLTPAPELRRVIHELPQRKFVFTNSDSNHANRVLKTLGLDGCFEKIIDILMVSPYCKPMPESFQIALREAGVEDPKQCVLIDDSVQNLSEARNRGFFTIHLGRDEAPGAYQVNVGSILEIQKVIDGLEREANIA